MNTKPRTTKVLGELGEKQARDFLIKKGYKILETNFRFKQLEIDIIALDEKEDEVVFVEVKTRSKKDFVETEVQVSQQQLARISTAAQIYLEKKRLNKCFRFDIISILPGKIEQFENVTAQW